MKCGARFSVIPGACAQTTTMPDSRTRKYVLDGGVSPSPIPRCGRIYHQITPSGFYRPSPDRNLCRCSVKESTVFTILAPLSISVPDLKPINKFINYITSNIERAPLTTNIHFSILTRIQVAILPPDFFRGQFDRLHTLRLDNCAPNWDSCISRKLTTLEDMLPTFIRGSADQKAHIRESLLELLSKAPVLEKLILVNCMISVYREDWWDTEFPAQGNQEWPILELPALIGC